MKNKFSLSVANPCQERWEQFTPTSQGGFCHSCNKTVVDFTTMSEDEIINFFKHTPAQSCGRFRSNQLKVYSTKTPATTPSHRFFLQAGLLGVLMLLGSKQGYSKSITPKIATHFVQLGENTQSENSEKLKKGIKGTVKDDYNEPLPGVNIYLKGTTIGTTTDANGNFTFPQELGAGDVLIFNFIGFETKEYVVTRDTSSVIELVMITLSMDILGEVAIDNPCALKPTGISKWWQQLKSLF